MTTEEIRLNKVYLSLPICQERYARLIVGEPVNVPIGVLDRARNAYAFRKKKAQSDIGATVYWAVANIKPLLGSPREIFKNITHLHSWVLS